MSDRREGRGRRSRLGNFRQGADGKYVYAGAHYVCRSDRPFGRYLAYVWIASAISFLSAVAGGCIGAPGMRGCAYLIIPYLVELALAGSIVWASFRLSEGGARLRDYEYRSAVESVPRRCIAFLVLAAVGALSETVYLILSGNEGRVISAILFFVLKALEILSALALRDIVRKTQWEREAPRSLGSDDESRTEK